jgi:hypothetical protein
MTSALIKLILGITLIVIAVAIGPIVGIWSLNTLFPVLHIELTWQTWLAFNIIFGSSVAARFKK